MTDHKPLESVFNKPTHTSSIWVQRIVNRMLDCDLVVEYRPGEENISDYTSQHPMPISECSKFELRMTKVVQQYVNYVVTCSTPKAVTRDQVKGATDEDPVLQALRRCINQGWIDTNDAKTQPYRQVFHELSIPDGIVLRVDLDRFAQKTETPNGGDCAQRPPGSGANKTAFESTCMVPGN